MTKLFVILSWLVFAYPTTIISSTPNNTSQVADGEGIVVVVVGKTAEPFIIKGLQGETVLLELVDPEGNIVTQGTVNVPGKWEKNQPLLKTGTYLLKVSKPSGDLTLPVTKL